MRTKINLILGALIALLSGCKSPKDIPLQSEKIMLLYGPPAYFQQQAQPNDTTPNNIEQTQNS